MPRIPRIKELYQTYHITQRGNNRENIFETNQDKLLFLEILFNARIRLNFYIYSYCIMNNHYHLLLNDNGNDISKIMNLINTKYSKTYNSIYKRSGHVFGGRFFSQMINSEKYLYEAIKYIHENPIVAGISINETEYKWSSAQ